MQKKINQSNCATQKITFCNCEIRVINFNVSSVLLLFQLTHPLSFVKMYTSCCNLQCTHLVFICNVQMFCHFAMNTAFVAIMFLVRQHLMTSLEDRQRHMTHVAANHLTMCCFCKIFRWSSFM